MVCGLDKQAATAVLAAVDVTVVLVEQVFLGKVLLVEQVQVVR